MPGDAPLWAIAVFGALVWAVAVAAILVMLSHPDE